MEWFLASSGSGRVEVMMRLARDSQAGDIAVAH
jgi:hypothetical protein